MKLHLLKGRRAYGYVQFGSIWERGKVRGGRFRLHGAQGREVPVQSRITAFWPDGSVKWAAHTADSRLMGEEAELSWEDSCGGDALDKEALKQESLRETLCTEGLDGWRFSSGAMTLFVPRQGKELFRDLTIGGELRAADACLKAILERRGGTEGSYVRTEWPGVSMIQEAVLEDAGPLMWSFCFRGTHVFQGIKDFGMKDFMERGSFPETGKEAIPFILRMKLYRDTTRIDMQHTFLYDGDETVDFLKGVGIEVRCPLKGDSFDRHVRFGTDYGSFHEASSLMLVWDHKHPGEIYDAQIKGSSLAEGCGLSEETAARLKGIAADSPIWDRYRLTQDSDMHFFIQKKTAHENCCFLNALHGAHAKGTMAFGGVGGSVLIGLRDFWQKYPSGLEVEGLSKDTAKATVWIYSPAAQAYDFRHYDTRGYAETCYEGFSDCGATPYGVANTNDCSIEFRQELIPEEDGLQGFGDSVSRPPLYFGDPEYYHSHRAFGFWSLPSRESETLCWLEDQLDKAVEFYQREVENRHWYGLYDYGDIMHTYDAFRHVWRYDIGGYAWQNTELMPTMWLWLAFLRTGREDILTLAEAMTRHASDIDTYHLGRLKGLGTRHGIRHWGCPCKEIRIGMAGHYRYHYYLLCDRRMEDVFEDGRDADFALVAMDPLRYVYPEKEDGFPTHARSGPDWSAMVSNWMTHYERTLDESYLSKIRVGMEDIKAAPLGLVSGPDFAYDPRTGHLGYMGESATGGIHLQVALGGPQVWMELADLLEDQEWKAQIAEYGRFYYRALCQGDMPCQGDALGEARCRADQQQKAKPFLYPIMASAMAAYGAWFFSDEALAKKTVQVLLRAMITGRDCAGFAPVYSSGCGNLRELPEIRWISTNFAAQWCLNAIVAPDFVRDFIPETLEEVFHMLEEFPEEGMFRNC